MLTEAVRNAYQSQRLCYMRINKQDDRVKSFLKDLFGDPEIHALANTMLMRPIGSDELDFLMGEFSSALLGVVICLLPSEVPDEAREAYMKNDGNQAIIIGELTVGEGGVPGAIAHHRNASIGIALSSAYQGKGYGREAINWALDWAFRHANMHTIGISTASFNQRAMRLYEDMGFVREGRRREAVWFDRAWHDDVLFSMTQAEWEAIRGKAHK
ncbi:hypothetical protein QQS21_002364 [Conoideocrella luteorostrata]|uniref:N-acetyltransferase domain-containing protein n=1 Tax=Conoideocrella luteorostrata TaxID=1105319 RepID=A0AAJ0FWP2_9HYPO|nr:hypothetical protein QQS21_002364 [Conoideocrella luteorostrata]